MDECHQLRNCTTTKKSIDEIAKRCPYVVYSSATIASTVRHLSYLERIGLWGHREASFDTFDNLCDSASHDGSGLLEMITMHLCRSGRYLCRHLSNIDTKFRLVQVKTTREQERIYQTCAKCFWGLHGKLRQSLMLKLITTFKVHTALQVAEEELSMGHSVVFSLVNTGEAAMKRQYTARNSIEEYLDMQGEEGDVGLETVDAILQHFGSQNVAEITGRTSRPRCGFESSCPTFESVPKSDVKAFQENSKRIAILSRSGGTGISLSDVDGRHKRVHIILEFPWSSEDFLQQIGRVHRTNSKSAPEYVLMTTTVPSEWRIVSSILGKLQALGAIVKADRDMFKLPLSSHIDWTAKTRNHVALQLSLSRRWDTYVEQDARRTEIAPGQSKQHFMNQIIRKLNFYDEEEEDESVNTWKEAIVDADIHFPNLTKPMQPWDCDLHKFYPFKFRQRVLTFLLCARHSFPLTLLPEPILHLIIGYMADVYDSGCVSRIANWLHADLKTFGSKTTTVFSNDMLGMPIDIQHDFMSLLSSHDTKCRKTKSIELGIMHVSILG